MTELVKLYLTDIVYRYLETGMSASPSQVYDLIPLEISDSYFHVSNRSRRTGLICSAIYALIDQGKIIELKGRYYKDQEYKSSNKIGYMLFAI